MVKRLLSNTAAKKAIVFGAAFAATCAVMGSGLQSMGGDAYKISHWFITMPEAKPFLNFDELDEGFFNPIKQSTVRVKMDYSSDIGSASSQVRPYIDTRRAVAGGFVYSESIPLSYDLQAYTYNLCVDRGLEYELVLALMWRESRFQIQAVNINTNGTQDSGVMQINDVNRQWLFEQYGIDDLMDPLQNINAGTIMLGNLVSKYGVHDALLAYQYGEYGMQQKISEGLVTNQQVEMLYAKRDDFRAVLRT